jgi:hypothetical protein
MPETVAIASFATNDGELWQMPGIPNGPTHYLDTSAMASAPVAFNPKARIFSAMLTDPHWVIFDGTMAAANTGFKLPAGLSFWGLMPKSTSPVQTHFSLYPESGTTTGEGIQVIAEYLKP